MTMGKCEARLLIKSRRFQEANEHGIQNAQKGGIGRTCNVFFYFDRLNKKCKTIF